MLAPQTARIRSARAHRRLGDPQSHLVGRDGFGAHQAQISDARAAGELDPLAVLPRSTAKASMR